MTLRLLSGVYDSVPFKPMTDQGYRTFPNKSIEMHFLVLLFQDLAKLIVPFEFLKTAFNVKYSVHKEDTSNGSAVLSSYTGCPTKHDSW